MPEWISNWSDVLNVGINFAMLLVWLVYLHVFVRTFRRSTRPRLIIARAVGRGPGAACFVSNMSGESVYVENVVATIKAGDTITAIPVIDIPRIDGEDRALRDQRQETHQGPLRPGDYISLGSFRSMWERSGQSWPPADPEKIPPVIEILVVADYASEELLIGAKRRFRLQAEEDELIVLPLDERTVEITGTRERRRLSRHVGETAN